jgi:peptidyl-tRNA hydrolase
MKLYLVARWDLKSGARAAQLCHALRAFVAAYPACDKEWYERSNTLVLLEVRDEAALDRLVKKCRRRDIEVAEFREPDLGNSLTAIAIGPNGAGLLRKLPLAFLSEDVLLAPVL